jgi:hypothetical protein
VLHLIKDPANATALEVLRAQAADPGTRLTVVLMHDAVRRLGDGHGDPPATGARAIGPSELLDLIFAADSVVTW